VKTSKPQETLAAARPTLLRNAPALELSNGAIEALKWLALILMTGDHVNKHLLHDAYPLLFALGRIASPLFCFVLAFNLARSETLERGVYARTITRLSIFALIASIPYTALNSMKPGYIFFGWWPLNILATLTVATTCIFFLDRGRRLDTAMLIPTFIIGGAIGEFWWPAVLLCISTWLYCRRPRWTSLFFIFVSMMGFSVINQNLWAFAALPLLFISQFFRPDISRTKLFFYIFYPAHFAVIWIIVSVIRL
jgi:hypothetical protein